MHDAETVIQDVPPAALPFRDHTILGVCEGIGEDFGFNPVWLRVPLATSVLLNPFAAIGAYMALGLVVLVSRLLFPKPKPAVQPVESFVAGSAPVEDTAGDDALLLAA